MIIRERPNERSDGSIALISVEVWVPFNRCFAKNELGIWFRRCGDQWRARRAENVSSLWMIKRVKYNCSRILLSDVQM